MVIDRAGLHRSSDRRRIGPGAGDDIVDDVGSVEGQPFDEMRREQASMNGREPLRIISTNRLRTEQRSARVRHADRPTELQADSDTLGFDPVEGRREAPVRSHPSSFRADVGM